MAQETKIRATRDEYIDSMLDVAYMAAQLVDDTDLGRNPHPLVDVLRAKVEITEFTNVGFVRQASFIDLLP